MRHEELDEVDRIILDVLQENAKTPLKEIATQVYLSTPAVSARIEKMRKRGLSQDTGRRSTRKPSDIISKH